MNRNMKQPAEGSSYKLFLLCLGIVALGLVIRVVAVQYGEAELGKPGFAAFTAEKAETCFTRIVRALLRGEGYLGADRPYLVPLLYTAYFWIANGSTTVLVALRLIECAFGALVAFYAARKIFPPLRSVAVLTLCMYSLNPYFAALQFSWTEISPVTIAMLWLMAESTSLWRRDRSWLADGLAWGLAAAAVYLSRPSLFAFPALFGLALFIKTVRSRSMPHFKSLVAGSIIILVAMSSWIGRNYYLYGEVILTRSSSPVAINWGHHPQLEVIYPLFSFDALKLTKSHTLEKYGDPNDPETYGRYVKEIAPPPLARAQMREVRDFYRKNPSKIFSRFLLKLLWFVDPRYTPYSRGYEAVQVDSEGRLSYVPELINHRPLVQRAVHAIIWPCVMLGTVIGFVVAFRKFSDVAVVYLLNLIGYLALAEVLAPAVKNRVAVEVSFYPLVGLALVAVWDFLQRRTEGTSTRVAADKTGSS